MARVDHPIHRELARLLAPDAGLYLDLGCGAGGTLAALAARAPGAVLVGVDVSGEALRLAEANLAERGLQVGLVRADLADPLPFADGTVDGIVCHNVLECLPAPGALLREAARVLRPGGRAVWSHVDFDALVVAGADPALDRRVLHAYADLKPAWLAHFDGRAGRKLAGLVRTSPLALEAIQALPELATSLASAPRVEEVVGGLTESAAAGAGPLPLEVVQRWRTQLAAADAAGQFLYAELTFAAVARRPGAA